METLPTKLFDVIFHPVLKKSWIHFDIEAIDEAGKKYYERSVCYAGYDAPYPAFPYWAAENYFTEENPHGWTLEPFDINKIMTRLNSYQWVAGVKSVKFSNQVYACPKTYIVWKFGEEKVEGTFHFEIKELPEDKKSVYVCDEQRHLLID